MSEAEALSEKAAAAAVDATHAALRAVSMLLPHLAGLAHLARVSPTDKVESAAIFRSGRMVVNPQWFTALTPPDRIFVAAHELMHLALRSHERCRGSEARLFNSAHDYIINDMLRKELSCDVPADGLKWPGAALLAAEEIVARLRSQAARGQGNPTDPWTSGAKAPSLGPIGEAMARAGLISPAAPPAGRRERQMPLDTAPLDTAPLDVFSDEVEREWFPDDVPASDAQPLEAAADRALALGAWRERAERLFTPPVEDPDPPAETFFEALAERVRPPWHLALQRWLDDVAPPTRSFSRASRRQGDRFDVVLPGRCREGWTLNVVLDTSGSMWPDLQKALGHLKGFCQAAGVHTLRILQCGDRLEVDERIDVDQLDKYRILGGGGGTLKPGMLLLAQDLEVEAVLVITDGEEEIPQEPMPYHVLWALTQRWDFRPGYGRIVYLTDD